MMLGEQSEALYTWQNAIRKKKQTIERKKEKSIECDLPLNENGQSL